MLGLYAPFRPGPLHHRRHRFDIPPSSLSHLLFIQKHIHPRPSACHLESEQRRVSRLTLLLQTSQGFIIDGIQRVRHSFPSNIPSHTQPRI